MKSEFLMSWVVARSPRYSPPRPGQQDAVAVDQEDAAVGGQAAEISDGPNPPVTRLSATDELEG